MNPSSDPIDPDGMLDEADDAVLAGLAGLYSGIDPVPDGLADRILFALELDDLEAELAQLQELAEPVGARAEEKVRTITFAGQNLTVMVTSTSMSAKRFRLDGWAAPGADLAVELRTGDEVLHTRADVDGRFEFVDVPAGRFHLVFRPADDGGDPVLRAPVVTPIVEL